MEAFDHSAQISPKVQALIEHFQFERIPIEGTLYKSTYVSTAQLDHAPIGTAILGLYSHVLNSRSIFHRLTQDEIWHFYDGDPFILHLLHPNGSYEKVIMGRDLSQGQKLQFVVPAHVWQAGELIPEGDYALYGCTLAPGFTGECFQAGIATDLLRSFPAQSEIIQRLSSKGQQQKMPKGFTQ